MIDKIEILHIPQTHRDSFKSIEEHKAENKVAADKLFDVVIQSQFRVANAIKNHPNIPVVSEACGCTLSYPLTDDVSIQLRASLQGIYPQGMPDNFNSLTDLQKRILYEYGAPFILFFLGHITTLYRSCDENGQVAKAAKEMSSIKDRKHINQLLDILDEPREKEAIGFAIEAVYLDNCKKNKASHPNTQVILVYGSAHNFRRHCTELFPSEYGQIEVTVQVLDRPSSNKVETISTLQSPDKNETRQLEECSSPHHNQQPNIPSVRAPTSTSAATLTTNEHIQSPHAQRTPLKASFFLTMMNHINPTYGKVIAGLLIAAGIIAIICGSCGVAVGAAGVGLIVGGAISTALGAGLLFLSCKKQPPPNEEVMVPSLKTS